MHIRVDCRIVERLRGPWRRRPAAPASASKPFFQASKSPPHSAPAPAPPMQRQSEAAMRCSPEPPSAPSRSAEYNDSLPAALAAKTPKPRPMQCKAPVAKCGRGRSIDYFVFAFSHFFQADWLPLKTLMSALPVMPGTTPVPVYCQKVKGWLPYFRRDGRRPSAASRDSRGTSRGRCRRRSRPRCR